MGRRNFAILDGPLTVDSVQVVSIDGRQVPACVCWIETDHPALGGRHQVVIYGQQAQEVIAFIRAGGGRVDATVDGWLRTVEGGTVVIADRCSFHVGGEVTTEARRLLQQGGG